MKRLAVLLAVMSALLLASSCEKEISDTGLSATESGLAADEKSGFCILDLLPLWDIVAGQTKWKDSLRIGEKVSLSGSSAKALQYGIERDFIQVRRDSGTEGWVRTDYIVSESMLGVITAEEAILHTHPNSASATGKALPRMTILAIHRGNAAQAFLRISAVDADHILRKEVFLHQEGISIAAADVESAMQFQMASQRGCCCVLPRRIIPTRLSLPGSEQP